MPDYMSMSMSNSPDYFVIHFTNVCVKSSQNTSVSIVTAYIYASTSLSFLNILLNAMALYVFRDRVWNSQALSLLLKSFALFEILFNVCLFVHLLTEIVTPSKYFLPKNILGAMITEVGLLVVDCLLIGFQVSRNWAVVALAYARYTIICHPVTQHGTWHNSWFREPRKCYSLQASVAILSTLLTVPRKFEEVNYFCLTDGDFMFSEPLLLNSIWFKLFYKALLIFFLQAGGPVILVITFSILILMKIRQQPHVMLAECNKFFQNETNTNRMITNRVSISRRSRSRNNASVLIIALCLTFAILEIPSFLNKLFPGNEQFRLFVNICVYMDSTLNFFIYVCSNRTFRQCLKQRYQSLRGIE